MHVLTVDLAVQWHVWNNGTLNARGYKCDSIYLSKDGTWDISDQLVGRPFCEYVSLPGISTGDTIPPMGSVFRASEPTPFVAQDEYRCIVRSRTNIRDPDLSNNIGLTTNNLSISAPTLHLGVPLTVSIGPDDQLLYRIEDVPGESTLRVTLKTTSANSGFHDLFLRHRDPPTGSLHDAYSQHSLSYNQSAVVQSTRPGTYYLRIDSFGRSISQYQIVLEARVAVFGITDISPPYAAPLGNVTLRIMGTLIENKFEASLIDESTSFMITAHTVYWFSSVEVYATFDLLNVSYGTYTVQIYNMRSEEYTQLRNALRVAVGIPGQISTSVLAPATLTRGRSTVTTVLVHNSGNTDLKTPVLFARSNRNDVQISYVDKGRLTSYRRSVAFMPLPIRGPAGIIPPGETTRVIFNILPSRFDRSINFRLSVSYLDEDQMNNTHIYIQMKDSLKPPDISDESWEVIWNTFVNATGTTWGSLIDKFSAISNEFSMASNRIASVDDLVDFQLRSAQGHITPNGMLSIGFF